MEAETSEDIDEWPSRFESDTAEPVQAPGTLEQLLEGINDDNLHPEQDMGPAVGREVW